MASALVALATCLAMAFPASVRAAPSDCPPPRVDPAGELTNTILALSPPSADPIGALPAGSQNDDSGYSLTAFAEGLVVGAATAAIGVAVVAGVAALSPVAATVITVGAGAIGAYGLAQTIANFDTMTGRERSALAGNLVGGALGGGLAMRAASRLRVGAAAAQPVTTRALSSEEAGLLQNLLARGRDPQVQAAAAREADEAADAFERVLQLRNGTPASADDTIGFGAVAQPLKGAVAESLAASASFGEARLPVVLNSLVERGAIREVTAVYPRGSTVNRTFFADKPNTPPFHPDFPVIRARLTDRAELAIATRPGESFGQYSNFPRDAGYRPRSILGSDNATPGDKIFNFTRVRANDGDEVLIGVVGPQLDRFGNPIRSGNFAAQGSGGEVQIFRPQKDLSRGFRPENPATPPLAVNRPLDPRNVTEGGNVVRTVPVLQDRPLLRIQERLRVARSPRQGRALRNAFERRRAELVAEGRDLPDLAALDEQLRAMGF